MSEHDEHQQMVTDCENRESKLTDWERTFIVAPPLSAQDRDYCPFTVSAARP